MGLQAEKGPRITHAKCGEHRVCERPAWTIGGSKVGIDIAATSELMNAGNGSGGGGSEERRNCHNHVTSHAFSIPSIRLVQASEEKFTLSWLVQASEEKFTLSFLKSMVEVCVHSVYELPGKNGKDVRYFEVRLNFVMSQTT